jgi:hypothetical protein
MPTSTAVVPTDVPSRYAKQLVEHLGRKNVVQEVPGSPHARRLVFAYGIGVVRPETARLVLDASAPDDEALSRVEDVLSRHLERFGQRNELVVTWQRQIASQAE